MEVVVKRPEMEKNKKGKRERQRSSKISKRNEKS